MSHVFGLIYDLLESAPSLYDFPDVPYLDDFEEVEYIASTVDGEECSTTAYIFGPFALTVDDWEGYDPDDPKWMSHILYYDNYDRCDDRMVSTDHETIEDAYDLLCSRVEHFQESGATFRENCRKYGYDV